MARLTFEQMSEWEEQKRIDWHKKKLQEEGENSLKKQLKNELAQGKEVPKKMKFYEYVEFLKLSLEQQ